MNRSRLQIAKADILTHFQGLAQRVLRHSQIAGILSAQRAHWRLAQSTTTDKFIEFLVKNGKLRELTFPFPARKETLYVWGTVPDFEVLHHLKPHAYLSHYTAMRIHGLTEQWPNTLYVSHERTQVSSWSSQKGTLSQSAIDAAFAQPARVSTNVAAFKTYKVTLLNSAYTGELGVITHHGVLEGGDPLAIRVTNIERTLIDATVRPGYSGGVAEVAKAFEVAMDDGLSVNALVAMLGRLDFTYPYHQAIGYYLERAGVRAARVDLLREIPREFDFYLDYAMGETRYEKAWRLYVPKNF